MAENEEQKHNSPSKTENIESSENDVLDMVFQLESEKQSLIEESRQRISDLRKELEVSKIFKKYLINFIDLQGKEQ